MTDPTDTRESLEQALLAQPFDHELRLRYAGLLLEHGEQETAKDQYRLVGDAQPGDARPLVGQARCLLAIDTPGDALALYNRARNLDGFEPDPQLEDLAANAVTHKPSLRAVPSGEVVELYRPAADAVRFDDIAGMEDLKKTLRLQIIEPFARPGLFSRFRKRTGGGVLLYGPPGCGKTLMARAIATECHAEFVSVGISDVLNMWMGESERNLSLVFEKARASRPCVLFFDELDALAFARSKASSEHSRTVVNEFLAQLDGFGKDNEGVLILGATNMPWDVDAAMKRPGRFAKQIFVPPPDGAARAAMFEMKLAEMPVEGLDFARLAQATEGFSGADIDGAIDEARDRVLGDIIDSDRERPMTQADLETACEVTSPTTVDWLKTARNLVRYGGADRAYKDVERYLKSRKLV